MQPDSTTPTPPRTREEMAGLDAEIEQYRMDDAAEDWARGLAGCAKCGHPRNTHLRAYGQEPEGLTCAMIGCLCMGVRGFLFA